MAAASGSTAAAPVQAVRCHYGGSSGSAGKARSGSIQWSQLGGTAWRYSPRYLVDENPSDATNGRCSRLLSRELARDPSLLPFAETRPRNWQGRPLDGVNEAACALHSCYPAAACKRVAQVLQAVTPLLAAQALHDGVALPLADRPLQRAIRHAADGESSEQGGRRLTMATPG